MEASKTVSVYSICSSVDELKELQEAVGDDNFQKNGFSLSTIGKPFICFTSDVQPRPVCVIDRRHAQITTRESHHLAKYSGISRIEYLRTCYLVARVQLRALEANRLLQPEDLQCQRRNCLFHWHSTLQESALTFESKELCQGCRDFYLALGVETELVELMDCLRQTSVNP